MGGASIPHVFHSRSELASALADAVGAELTAAIARRGTAFLAVSGGTTPGLFFASLAVRPLDWARVVVTLVDERFVPPPSPRSNAALVTSALLNGPASAARFVPLFHEADRVEEACALAADALRGLPWPLDVAVLGMGADGHTASFFPDAANLGVLLDPASERLILPVHAASAGEPRLTLPLARIIDARMVALHVEGPEKRRVLDRALEEGERLPIRAVFEHAPNPVEIFWAE